jgi:hypothetical protein
MREDMYKVIVERPRRGSRHTDASAGRIFRNSEDAPSKLGIKQGHRDRKDLNENLRPLRRFLESQIGRPWNKVYADLSRGIDRRNTVQEHIYTHIESYVAFRTKWVARDGRENNGECVQIIRGRWWGGTDLLKDSYVPMYVHPLTGILLRNRYYLSYAQRVRLQRANDQDHAGVNRIVISAEQELHRIDGLWFAIDFAEFAVWPQGETKMAWDVLRKAIVSGAAPERYAQRKRQLNSKELVLLKKAHPGLFFNVRQTRDQFCWVNHPPLGRGPLEFFDKTPNLTTAQT